MEDLEDAVARGCADDRRIYKQLDRRSQTLLGHAELRLSRRVRAATGAYHDRHVELILEDLREGLGLKRRELGTLKARRGRWTKIWRDRYQGV